MSSSTTPSHFQDYAKIRCILPSLRVEELKTVLRDINSNVDRAFAKLTGRKDELIQRIEAYLQDAVSAKAYMTYESIRCSIYRQKEPSREPYIPFYSPHNSSSNHQSSSASTPAQSHRAPAPTLEYGSASLAPLASYHPLPLKADPIFGTTSSMIRPNGYPPSVIHPSSNSSNNHLQQHSFHPKGTPILPPFNPSSSSIGSSAHKHHHLPSSVYSLPGSVPILFESSPYYRLDAPVSMLAICHRAAQNDRKSVQLSISLSSDQRKRLLQTAPTPSGGRYQLRLFCTSETFFHHPAFAGHLPTLPPAPIDFPLSIEVKLNSCICTANLRGIKKQPGTAPPPDLALVPGRNGAGHALDLREGVPNQVEVAYTNSDKRYYCVIYLVEYFGIPTLLKSLKTQRPRSEAQVLQDILASSRDDEVITSSSVVTLMDPVVFSRIKMPIRSSRCNHLQCFDAEKFYMMMEATPTWLCPVCNVKIKNEDISIDEYFEGMLNKVPTSVDSVIVEADGTWHDERFKYGTSVRKATRSVFSIASGSGSGSGASEFEDEGVGGSKRKATTVLEVDSDEADEDDDDDDDHDRSGRQYKRQRLFAGTVNDVIDLTLDDD